MRVVLHRLLSLLFFCMLAPPAWGKFPVAAFEVPETYPAVAADPRSGEFMAAYRVPGNFGFLRLLVSRFDAGGNRLGDVLLPEFPLGPPPAPYQQYYTLIGRPAIAYSPDSDRYLVAVPQRLILGGYHMIGVWLLDGSGVLQSFNLLFMDSSPLYYPGPQGLLDVIAEHSALGIVHNSRNAEFVVTVQRSTLDENQQRREGLWALRLNAGDGSLVDNMSPKLLIDAGLRSHTLVHAPVPSTPGGVYLLVGTPWVEHRNGPMLLQSNLEPIPTQDTTGDGTATFPLIPLNYGYPEPGLGGATAFQAAYGIVEGQQRFLLVWVDADNCRPGLGDGNGGCQPGQQWFGVWGTYIDPDKRLYGLDAGGAAIRDNTPFPISKIGYHYLDPGWQYHFTPRVTYNPANQGFAVVWRQRPAQNEFNDESLTHIRGVWVDYFVPDGLYGTTEVQLPHDNRVISDVTLPAVPAPTCRPGNNLCPSAEDPVLPAVAPLGGNGAVVVWQQQSPSDSENLDILGDIFPVPPVPVPENDACTAAIDIGVGQHEGTLAGAGNDGSASCADTGAEPDVWYRYTATRAGELTVDTCGTWGSTLIDTLLSVHADACPASSSTERNGACSDNTLSADTGCDYFDARLPNGRPGDPGYSPIYLNAGESVLIRVSQHPNNAPGRFGLNLAFSPDGDGDGYAESRDCDDTDPGVFPEAAERCDGIDNDCDDLKDEDFTLGQSCAVGEGSCRRSGVLACTADGSGTVCDAVPGSPVAELCDSRDNDCDGQVDEDFSLGQSCTVGTGVCEATGVYACLDEYGVYCEAPPSCNTPRSDTPVTVTQEGVSVTFPSVEQGGNTGIRVEPCPIIPETGFPDTGFVLWPTHDDSICAWIETDAVFNSDVTVCIGYDENNNPWIPSPPWAMFRCNDGICTPLWNTWLDTADYPKVCARTPHFSLFVLGTALDSDGDGTLDLEDDCPWTADAAQQDSDGDGVGDACDHCPGTADPTNICGGNGLELRSGFNLIGTPTHAGKPGLSAFGLLAAIGDATLVSHIGRFNTETGVFEQAYYQEDRILGTDFPVTPGIGYLLYMKQPVTGLRELRKGFNLISAPNLKGSTGVTAFSLLSQIGDETRVSSIQRINPATGRIETASYDNGRLVGIDFPISSKAGYILYMR